MCVYVCGREVYKCCLRAHKENLDSVHKFSWYISNFPSSYLANLADLILHPDNSSSSLGDVQLPSLSANLLLQPFIPIVSFPGYFHPLYKFLHQLEQLCREGKWSNQDLSDIMTQRAARRVSLELNPAIMNRLMGFISEHLHTLLQIVNLEGFTLLLLHLFQFFQYPETCFEALCNFLDPLAQCMNSKNVDRLFSAPLIRMFDSPIEPYQRGQLLNRSTADILIRRFGLNTFLNRFLGFIIEAVIEPSHISSKSHSRRVNAKLFRLQSESMVTLQSDLLQSSRFDDGMRRNMSEFTFSLALSEGRTGYDSDKDEWSSADSDEEFPPEASLLAKSGTAAPSDTDGGKPTLLHLDQEAYGSEEAHASEVKSRGRSYSEDQIAVQPKEEEAMLSLKPKLNLERSIFSAPGERVLQFDDLTADTSGLSHHEKLHSSLRMDTGSSFEYRTRSSTFSDTQSISSTVSDESVIQSYHDVIPTPSMAPSSTLPERPHFSSLASPLRREVSLTVGHPLRISTEDILGDEGEENEEEEERTLDNESMCSADPQTLIINNRISRVAADCIIWLVRRLGPFLATHHIAKPLLDNLYRCFTGILHLRGKEAMAIKCLSAVADLYGEDIITKLYLPHAESLVGSSFVILCLRRVGSPFLQ